MHKVTVFVTLSKQKASLRSHLQLVYATPTSGARWLPELAAAWVEGVAPTVPEVVGVYDAERAGRRQRPRFRAAQQHAVLAEPPALAVWAAREIEITSEHLTRIARVSFERVGRGASTALVQLTS